MLATYFPTPGFMLQLNPAYEPERNQKQRDNPDIPPPDPVKNAIFKTLQNCVRVNLLIPVGETHTEPPRVCRGPISPSYATISSVFRLA
jgi:hypothetical protein